MVKIVLTAEDLLFLMKNRETALYVEESLPEASPARCRVCGCTEEKACPGGCSWVEVDLCSRCAEKTKKPLAQRIREEMTSSLPLKRGVSRNLRGGRSDRNRMSTRTRRR